jgi:hypothetical protein
MEMGGLKKRIKVLKLVKIYSTMDKGCRLQWKTVGGWRGAGAIKTDDNCAHNMLSLNKILHI